MRPRPGCRHRRRRQGTQARGRLGARHCVKPVPREGEVDGCVTLRLVEGVGGDEDGGVAAANHAVVEEEAERGAGGGRRRELLVGDGFSDDVVEFGTGFLVVVGGELGLDQGKEG